MNQQCPCYPEAQYPCQNPFSQIFPEGAQITPENIRLLISDRLQQDAVHRTDRGANRHHRNAGEYKQEIQTDQIQCPAKEAKEPAVLIK